MPSKSGIRKIINRYNPEHDLGPDAPIHWSVFELADIVDDLVDIVEKQQEQIDRLLAAVPQADRKD
jgi:hypothetical protein